MRAARAVPPPPGHRALDAPPPGVPLADLLLGLGTALVVVAAVVFAAVSWSRLGAAVQGLLLLGVTGAAMAGTALLRRRGLTATAEALAVVAVALLVVDAEALREAWRALGHSHSPGAALVYWCAAIGGIAPVCWWFGRLSATRAPAIAAAVAAQVPVPLFVVGRAVPAVAGQLACLAQAAVTLAAIDRLRTARTARRRAAAVAALASVVLTAGGAVLWLGATAAAIGYAVDGGTSGRLAGAGVVVLAAAVAALACVVLADDRTARPAASGASTATGLAAGGLALSAVATGEVWVAVMAGAAVAAMAVALRLPRRWGSGPAVVAGAAAAALSVPLAVTVVAAGVAAIDTMGADAWRHGPGASTRALAGESGTTGLSGLAAAAHLVVAAGAVVALRGRIGARAARLALVAVAAGGLALVPIRVDVPVSAAVTGLLAAVGLLAIAARPTTARPGGTPGTALVDALVPAATLAGLALAWAAAAPATTVGALAAGAALATAVALVGHRDGGRALTAGAAVVAVVTGCAAAGLAAAALGAAPAAAWAVAAVAAVAASGLAAALDPPGTGRVVALPAAEIAAGAVHTVAAWAAVELGDAAVATVVLSVGAAGAAAHALRPGRRPAAAWAVGEALLLTWLRLADASVRVPEAYTLPAAVAVLVTALVARRSGRASLPSWSLHGPWLVGALAPTVLLALDDPGLTRPLGGLAAGVAVVVAGATTRTRAAVDVGGAAVTVLALRQLSPVVADLPNWVTLGAGGIVLLVVGATFERRRRDLAAVRTYYAELS